MNVSQTGSDSKKAEDKKSVDLKKLQLKTSVGLNGDSPQPSAGDIRKAKQM